MLKPVSAEAENGFMGEVTSINFRKCDIFSAC
jgi:hypothetical protein